MNMKPLNVAVVGCGHICGQYGRDIQKYPDHLKIVGAYDMEKSRSEEFVKTFGGKSYDTYEEVLADPEVDLMVNLTIHHVHFDLNKRALEAGKHVYSEKPMALKTSEAAELAELARAKNLRIGAAPSTFLGAGVQTASQFLSTGKLGDLRLVYAEVNWGQIERWISNPAPYYTVGPLLDVGVYAITAMVYLLGPAKKVWGYSTILKNPRSDKNGKGVSVTAPDFTVGIIEFASGVKARITTNYYLPPGDQKYLKGLHFHGDEGTFVLGCYHNFNPECSWYPYNTKGISVPLLDPEAPDMDRAAGIVDLAQALAENRPHLASAEQAVHVIEIMEGLQKSWDESKTIELQSTPPKGTPASWTQGLSLQIPSENPQ